MDSAGRAGTLVRTEENIAARLRAEPWAKAGGGWGVWGACPWLVSRTRDNTAVGFLVLREDATGSHSELMLGPLADSAPSWKADNIGRGVAPGTPSFCLERGSTLHEMYAKREWRRCCVPVDNGVTLEEVAIASSDVIPAIAKFVAETAINCGAGRVECSLPFDHPCARFLAHVGPAVGT